jgi:predicted DNA-binding protein YlxM (UPF0122 family)
MEERRSRVSKNQLIKKTDDDWKKKKIYLWIIGAIIILALISYYVVSKDEKSIEMISFIASISSIVLAISTIIISKNYNKSTGEVLEHIESSVDTIIDELKHRINTLEEMKISLKNLPGNTPEREELFDKIEEMEEEIITSPLLASERSHHEDNEIRKYERKIRSGQRKLYQYNNDLKESSSEKERIKIREKMDNTEAKIKLEDEQLKEITCKYEK